MSRFSRQSWPAIADGLPGSVVGCRLLRSARCRRGDAQRRSTTVVLGQTSDDARPLLPRARPARRSAASPASRSAPARRSLPFLVPHDGKIKSWTLTLAQPTNRQRSFFNGFFGTPPRGAAGDPPPRRRHQPAALQPAQPGLDPRAQPYLGQTVKFGASLTVEKGDIVGLTVPTWAPAFAQGLSTNNVWRASREAGQLHQLDRRPPGRTAAARRPTRHLRLPLHHGPPALHRHRRVMP